MSADIRIAVVDDHPLLREGVIRSLSEFRRFEIVGEGASADDAIRLVTNASPDILLLDISMPGGGLTALKKVQDIAAGCKVAVLTASEVSEDITACLDMGARAYILKGVGSRALIEILLAVHKGEIYVTPSLSARLLTSLEDIKRSGGRSNPLTALTGRELDVLRLVAEGKSNKLIGLELDLQEKTVKHHMSKVLSKLEASNRTSAAMIYRKWAV